MADIKVLLDSLREPSEEGVSDSVYDDIGSAYDEAVEIRDAKIAEYEERIQSAESEISRLKSANYDLLMSTTVDDSNDNDSDDSEDEESSGVDSLFE